MWRVIGENRAVSLLQRSLEANALAHAYLFVGPAHVGKMTLALNLAQALNCAGADPPCSECVPCQRIALGKHTDVELIGLGQDGALSETKPLAEISIERIRELQHSASLPPFEGKCKIFIIDGAEFLSLEAANCLLKTLEEPVGRVVFILLTTNERLLPATVVSRCQRLELFPLAVTEVETALQQNWGIAEPRAKLLARLSHGYLGWAVSVASDDSLLRQRAEWLDGVVEMIKADDEARFLYAAQLATQFSQKRGLVQERLDLWLDWWRDLLLVKAGSSGDITNIDRLATLTELAKDYRLAQIKVFLEGIRTAKRQLKQNANPQLVLEVLMLRLPEAERYSEVNYG